MKTSVIDGKIDVEPKETTTVTEPVEVATATSYSIDWTEPGRKYYWSHDTRTFEEANGLLEMSAKVTLFKYYVDANGSFVDADGNASAEMVLAEAAKELDVTANTRTLEATNTAEKVWNARTDEHQHKYDLEFYFYTSEVEDPDFKNLNGGEPLLMGTHTIMIGVKGDATLDDKVDTKDANLIQVYFNEKVILDLDEVHLNEDAELEGLAIFLGNVYLHTGSYPDNYKWETEPYLDSKDANAISTYYNLKDVILVDDASWDHRTVPVGYDFPDLFYHGWEPFKANP
jgi:hypothetical protein